MDLLDERAKIFLPFQSLLFTAFAFGKSSVGLALIIPLLGLATSLLWLYMGHRTLLMYGYFREVVKGYERNLPDLDRIFTNEEKFRNEQHPPFLGIRVSSYVGYGLPLILIAAWVSLFILAF